MDSQIYDQAEHGAIQLVPSDHYRHSSDQAVTLDAKESFSILESCRTMILAQGRTLYELYDPEI
jgi:hypothetical protein